MNDELIESGIAWIGGIPNTWKVKRIKDIASLQSGDNITSESITENGDYPVYGGNGLRGYFDNYTHEGYYALIGRQGALCGNINYARGKFWASEHAVVVSIFDGSNTKWLGEVMRAMNLNQYSQTAAQPGLAVENIKRLKLPYPPKPEQEAIARHLDTVTARIDETIAIKQQQVAKLEAYQKTRITELTTQGLSNEILVESNFIGLGKIPAHWKARKLKRVLKDKLRYGAIESAEFDERDYPRYIRITDFGDDGKLREETFKSLPPEIAKDYLVEDGDILFARSGATVGKTFLLRDYNGVACYAGYLIKATVDQTLMMPEFLYYFTKSKAYDNWKNLIFTQATIQNIGADKYQYLGVPIPPISEQVEIVSQIADLTNKLSKLNESLIRQIAVLQAYRRSVIHEYVTGKKRVAMAQPALN